MQAKLMANFIRLASTSEIPEGTMKNFEVAGEEVLVANVAGKYYAVGNRCTHVGAPLAEGKLEGHLVECPWHGSQFDLGTGSVVAVPAREALPMYEVKVDGTNILVNV